MTHVGIVFAARMVIRFASLASAGSLDLRQVNKDLEALMSMLRIGEYIYRLC
jgi:hypothetical protein